MATPFNPLLRLIARSIPISQSRFRFMRTDEKQYEPSIPRRDYSCNYHEPATRTDKQIFAELTPSRAGPRQHGGRVREFEARGYEVRTLNSNKFLFQKYEIV